MIDVDIMAQALANGYACDELANEVSQRYSTNQQVYNALNTLSQNISSTIETITTGKDLASEGAEYFNAGAYKDGITDFANDIHGMTVDAGNAIYDLTQLKEQIDAYNTELSSYLEYLTEMESFWREAYSKYLEYLSENGMVG